MVGIKQVKKWRGREHSRKREQHLQRKSGERTLPSCLHLSKLNSYSSLHLRCLSDMSEVHINIS